MISKILIGLALALAVLVIVIVLQPGDFRVTRTTTVSAPTSTIFPYVNDFHHWSKWSPWAKLDPNMKEVYEGPAQGAGAIYSWSGDNKVGEGRMTIRESRPTEHVAIHLEFLKPFEATNTTEFTFKAEGAQTQVVWTMYGKSNFLSKAMGLFMNMDKMIGADFEKGLAQLKAISESAPKS
ncbi:MAG TPA: SRPBCC family protein [Opitutaceae bacterium]|nr:SRPBCC family protein [Opitutaceae bacterium]